MRILLVTQYFYPETFKGNDIAFELTKRGHKVDVLCGIPNYPNGSYTMGYGIFKKRRETINGVNIYRTFQFPRGKSSKFMMILNYFSFPFCACFYILCLEKVRCSFCSTIISHFSSIASCTNQEIEEYTSLHVGA